MAGCIAAGIYTSNLPEACGYITNHSMAEVVVVEDNKQLAKYAQLNGKIASVKALVVWSGTVDEAIAAKCGVPVYSWANFLELGN